jgi:FAD/FMN-containing dehydrogenase
VHCIESTDAVVGEGLVPESRSVSPAVGLIGDLRVAVGPDQVLTEPDLKAGYVRDWTGRWIGNATAVVRPGSVEEVQRVVRICQEAGAPLVPQGGNTGLVGGSIPHRGEVLVSLRRLDRLGPVVHGTRSVIAGAGVTLGRLQAHARKEDLVYAVDLASRDSATVAGTIATNAGGAYVVSRGDTRRQVLGLEVVLADGSLVSSLETLPKVSTGPDLIQSMIGSEGTLGVITSAHLRLSTPSDSELLVVLIGMDTLTDGLRLMGPGLRAIEFFDRACLEAVIEHRGLARPIPGDFPFYVLVETTGNLALDESSSAVVDRSLWVYRESITETINGLGVPLKLDVAVPLDRIDEFATVVRALDTSGEVFLYGHLAEGNFHVNMVGSPDPARASEEILGLVVSMGGAIASEHGIGVAKTDWWRRTTDPGSIELARRVKEALDPNRILNPGVFWG